jgi:hypothetical protein
LVAEKSGTATKFVAHFSTSGKIDVIENWLKQYARGRWPISTEGISEDLLTKKYRAIFTEREDYAKFRSRFT